MKKTWEKELHFGFPVGPKMAKTLSHRHISALRKEESQ
jgi:hypothetical protein